MNADFESNAYASHHRLLTRDIRRFVRHTLTAFARLHRRQYDAPWRPARTPCPR